MQFVLQHPGVFAPVAIATVAILTLGYAFLNSERKWRKRLPGVDEYCSRVDREVSAKGL